MQKESIAVFKQDYELSAEVEGRGEELSLQQVYLSQIVSVFGDENSQVARHQFHKKP